MSQPAIKQAKFEVRNINELTNWENNPRSILAEEFKRLQGQIAELGVYKTLLINQDNIVLGGNMRLRAFKELGITEVMCGIVETKDPGEMLKYALSDNDNAGTTDELKLQEVYALYPIDTQLYKIQAVSLRPLESIINPPDPMVGAEAVDRSELDEDLNQYLNGSVRQIVLYFDKDQFEDVVARLDKLNAELKTQNHTELFLKLLESYEAK